MERVIARLGREFSYHLDVEALLWEREPLTADAPFQANITPPRDCDTVLVLIWSRLGTLLPADQYPGAITGGSVTGTQWEFEDAIASARASGQPDVLLYRKTAPVPVPSNDPESRRDIEQQLDLVQAFLDRWVRADDGAGFKAAFHDFSEAADLEAMLEAHLRGLLRNRLDPAARSGEPPTRKWFDRPYRGLEAFGLAHAPIFHGRTNARNQLRQALLRQADRGRAFVLVLGSSGSGKSSLVQAGLLADLRVPGLVPAVGLCRYAVVRPAALGADLLHGLATALMSPSALPELADLEYSPDRLAAIMADSPGQLELAVEQGLAAAGRAMELTERATARFALVVDQLEEIFTLDTTTVEARDAFVDALGVLAQTGRVWVVATMRSDFFDRLAGSPALANLSDGDGRFLLTPPTEAELAQIVRGPAREAGLRFEHDAATGTALDEAVLEASARNPDALPLLEYLLDQLWDRRTEAGELTFEAYNDIGGLEGALGQRAEAIFDAVLSPKAQEAFPRVLRALVTVGAGPEGAVTARSTNFADFPESTPAREVVDAYLAPDARLLTAEGGDAEGARIRVAHEALLTHWDRAARQIRTDWSDLQVRSRLERSETRWRAAERSDRKSLLLASGLPLAEAEDLAARRGDELTPELHAYVKASRDHARRRTRLLQATAAAMVLLAVAAGAGAWFSFMKAEDARTNAQMAQRNARIAEQQEGKARYNEAVALAALSKIEIERGNYILGANLALASWPRSGAESVPKTRSGGLALIRSAFALGIGRIPLSLPANSWDFDVSADARFGIVRGPKIYLFDSLNKQWGFLDKNKLEEKDNNSSSVAISKSGKFIAIGTEKGDLLVSSVAGMREIFIKRMHEGKILSIDITSDDKFIATGSVDQTAKITDLQSGKLLHIYGGNNAVDPVQFSPSGMQLAYSYGNKIVLAKTDENTKIIEEEVTSWVTSLEFSNDAKRILVSYQPLPISQILVVSDLSPLVTFRGHNDAVKSARFSNDEKYVVTASDDGTARWWDVETGEELFLFPHKSDVDGAAFIGDGTSLFTTSFQDSGIWSIGKLKNGRFIHEICRKLINKKPAGSIQYKDINIDAPICTGSEPEPDWDFLD